MTARRLALVIGLAASLVAGDVAADARAEFRRGLSLYAGKEYAAAAAAFEQAYRERPTPTILFAWAQAVRQGGDCRKAVVMYSQLLRSKLRRKQHSAVKKARSECERALAAEPAPAPDPQPTPEPKPEPAAASAEPVPPAIDPEPPPLASSPRQDDRGGAWYADPVGGALLASGVAGLGIGVGFWIAGSAADHDADDADNYFEFSEQKDKASSRRTIAAISGGAGGALIVAAILRYALADHGGDASAAPAAWIAPGGGVGFGLGGRF